MHALRARLRTRPAWQLVLAFGVVAAAIRLAGDASEGVVAPVLLLTLLAVLALVLIDRGDATGGAPTACCA